ncbi:MULTISPECIES: hypothetical protein [Pseudomonas]|jgi:hypothetical protein|uniref:Uncharacterized protein n=1 Tax=Pseudomonas palleroniana TaxID=191390 RepID=A0A2L1JDJ1_9PSED|nr:MULTISPECIES: hypothetical protein [Pseudomonas]AVE06486.1 hypothetical protein CYL20_18650 [Pseudomonas palleroniana]NCE82853.1 hypothetical protein [Pseudomonas sp. Q1]UOP13259.1 hypothetical protein LDL65_12115 [Pseudomonas palleroniana]
MSNLQKLIENAKSGLSVQEKISDEDWQAIAKQCGASEIAEIEQRIARLRAELETVEEWDGDTQDDIHLAISRFTQLLRSAKAR